MDGWIRARAAARPRLVLPADQPLVTVPGSNPDRVLLIGSGPAAGVGVSTHDDALTGALARSLAGRRGCGATVQAIGRPDLRLAEVPDLVTRTRLHHYDAVIIIAGMIEATLLTRPSGWRATLNTVLDALQHAAAGDTRMLLVAMPPVTSVSAGAGVRGALTDLWATRLNRVTYTFAQHRDHVHVAQLQPPQARSALPTAAWYRAWAEEITDVLHPVLPPAPH